MPGDETGREQRLKIAWRKHAVPLRQLFRPAFCVKDGRAGRIDEDGAIFLQRFGYGLGAGRKQRVVDVIFRVQLDARAHGQANRTFAGLVRRVERHAGRRQELAGLCKRISKGERMIDAAGLYFVNPE